MTSLSKPSNYPSLFSYVNLVHAIAGGCGSAFAMTTFYPLDIVRTRLQLEDVRKSKNTFVTMLDIYQQEGISGLYRGLLPVIESLYCSNFVYFYSFHALKSLSNKEKSAIKDLALGMIAGCINVLTTTPLWVVNTRIKMQGSNIPNDHDSKKKYKGLIHGLLKISREEGIGSLWSGTLSSLLLVINPAIQFMTYEALKRRAERLSDGKQLGVTGAFLAGAIAKALATLLTYPLQLVQAKQRHGHNYPGLAEKAGIVPMIMYIVKLQGARGLFKGLEAKVLQTVLTAALMFVFYEKIASYVFSILMRTKSMHRN